MSGGQPYRRFQWWSDVVPRVTSFAWLPDSRHLLLAVTSLSTPGSHLWTADLQTDRAWSLTRGPGSESYPSPSPDGTQIVFATGEPDYDVVETSLTGGVTRTLLATARNESDPVWSPGGAASPTSPIAAGRRNLLRSSDLGMSDRPVITQRDLATTGRSCRLASRSRPTPADRATSNASKPIWPLRIWISQTAGGPPVPLVPPSHEGYQGAPTWSPDGLWIAYAEWTERQWTLAKVRVGSGEAPVVLRANGIPNASPSWSPSNDWITWETDQGFVLVSPDGKRQRMLSDDHWLAHTWSRDGSLIYGIRETERLRPACRARRALTRGRDRRSGPSPPVNNPVKGLSVGADGRSIVTSLVRLRGESVDPWRDVRWRDRRRMAGVLPAPIESAQNPHSFCIDRLPAET
jgi:Tol biopolymer transport system component